MIRRIPLSATLVFLSLAPLAFSQEEPKDKPVPAKVPAFSSADKNNDSAISEQEFYDTVVTQSLEYHDTNGDKTIDQAEAEAHSPKRKNADTKEEKPKTEQKPAKPRVNVQFKNIDVNADGKASQEELKAALIEKQQRFQSVFQLLDTNKDGQINTDEWTSYSDQQAASGGGVPVFRITF